MRPTPFIVGVGRSGTTLLRLMLDAHPLVAIPPETHFLADMLASPPGDAGRFMAVLMRSHGWQDFHLDERALARAIVDIQPFDFRQAVRVFYRTYAARFEKERWGDKTPPYIQYLTGLHTLLPEIRFIHLIRDGRDVVLSYRDKWFGPGRDIRTAACFWRDRILDARRQAGALPEGSYLEVRYEDLVAKPECTLRDICARIDLPYAAEMLGYHGQAGRRLGEFGDRRDADGNILVTQQQRLDIHRNALRPPDAAQIGKWRQVISSDERSLFECEAGLLLRELGYAD